MRVLAAILSLVICIPAHAEQDVRSVGWQKVMLEQALQERINGVLSAYVKGSEFVSRVDVIASRIKSQRRYANAGTLSLGKLDMIAPAPPSSIQDSEDVFSYLERVNVSVTLPKKILDLHKAEIEKQLNAAISPVTQTPVTVALEAFNDKDLKEANQPTRTWLEFVEAQAMPIAILVGIAFMVLLFMRLLSVYRSIETKKLETIAKTESFKGQLQSGKEQEEESTELERGNKGLHRPQIIDQGLTAQIQSVVTVYPQKIPNLVRRWLTSDNEKSSEALWILPKLLPMSAMVQLAAQLDDAAKRGWRSILEEPSPTWSELSGQEFIAHELIDDVLRQSFPLADDLRQLLEGVKTDEVAEIAAKDAKQGALLINILSTAQSARVLTLLPTDVRTLVVAQCPSIELDDVVKMTPIIRQELQKLRHRSDVVAVPFTDRALELIREVGPDLEGDIYDALARSLPRAELLKSLVSVCPVDIILGADSRLHRQCLTTIPLSQRADLIYAAPESRKTLLLNAFPVEEKVRELLDEEISMLEHDQARASKARRDSEKLWRSYIQACRRLIQFDELAAESVKPAMNRWIETRSQGEKRNVA